MNRRRRIVGLFTILVLLMLALALRFRRLDEMEYKGDEQWMYERATRVQSLNPLSLVGMRSSTGLPNPGLSVLLFVGLAKVRTLRSAVDLADAVVALNIFALALVFFVGTRLVVDRERDAWQWGGALAAVSPFAVLFQRKIWAQSALPLFCVLFLIGWFRRDRRWGALLWGVLSAILGQIHLSGFFLAGGFLLWEVCAGRYRAVRPETRWRPFAAGVTAGGIGILLWIVALCRTALAWMHSSAASAQWGAKLLPTAERIPWSTQPIWMGRTAWAGWSDFHILSLWPSHWLNWFYDASGLGLEYSLGPHYLEFLRGPILFGRATSIALIATLGSAILAAWVAGPWAFGILRDLRTGRLPLRLRNCGETAFTEGAALGAFALLLTATGLMAHRHYLIVAYPLPWVWLARLTLQRARGRALLTSFWIAQLVISFSFLGYIHAHHGAQGGDYGLGYRWQMPSPDSR